MLFRSTGLGKTELVGEIDHIERQGDYLILHVNTLEPVRWKIRGAISYHDLMTMLRAALKASVIAFVLSPFKLFRSAKHPGDF
jgi:hypothetical protein